MTNRPDNMKLGTKSEKQKRVISRNRLFPFLQTADRSGWKKNYSSSKPVAQYDLKGNLINKYPSIREAARQVHIEDKAIIQVAKGKYKQWKGFVWKYL